MYLSLSKISRSTEQAGYSPAAPCSSVLPYYNEEDIIGIDLPIAVLQLLPDAS